MNSVIQQICYLILLFFIFSVLGWCMEVFFKYRQYGRFINRGFFIGPYLPIYGSGVVFITVTVNALSGVDSSIGTSFMISFIGCGILEYAVSYYMEKRFHARWWDYSTKPMNLHGRIWIGNLILFGIGGTIIIEVVNPILYSFFYKIPETLLYIFTAIIVIVMSADYVISHFIMRFVKTSVENSEADNTESISLEIRMLMRDKSILYKRIMDAYPEVIYRTERINQRLDAIKIEMERLQQEASQNIEILRTSSFQIQTEIISLQDELIDCLRQDPENEESISCLLQEIQDKKKRLEDRKKYRVPELRKKI